MKVLQIHHHYSTQAPSGEDAVVSVEAYELKEAGHEVTTLSREWDPFASAGVLGLAAAAVRSVWNPVAARQVGRACASLRPDIVHIHNTFPSFSPSVFSAAHRHAPTVFTLHNYRALCAAAVASRDNRPCFDCLEKRSIVPALRYGCYRHSHASTLAPALMVATHRAARTWERHVDAFIALSEFQRDTVVRAGWPAERIHVKPNACHDPGAPAPWAEREPRVVFAGRLSPEKGGHVLLDAWHRWGPAAPELLILGSGPEEARLREQARNGPASERIRFQGYVPPYAVRAQVAKARLVVVPSLWAEGFPLIVAESFAAGTPVAVPDFGTLAELVEDGRTGVRFTLGDSQSLAATLQAAWAGGALGEMGLRARRTFEERYARPAVFREMLRIYQSAREQHARPARVS